MTNRLGSELRGVVRQHNRNDTVQERRRESHDGKLLVGGQDHDTIARRYPVRVEDFQQPAEEMRKIAERQLARQAAKEIGRWIRIGAFPERCKTQQRLFSAFDVER
ncbi:hypothetical protein GCM10007036_30200 [Alsobacter metallidurans]|uniref:Uncharacterized protein n=1 Tax=Alsobacter metallidurans TaxID=340221 RepID=A0A917MIF5_9HYPH|nr:hypothetical protein GCM10007036_30200 [Alsobacter metallidurans]